MFNIYTCTQGDLLSIPDVGPATVEKIFQLREAVFRTEKPLIIVDELGAIRLGPERWQEMIDNGSISLAFNYAKPKTPQGASNDHIYAENVSMNMQSESNVINDGPVHMHHSQVQGDYVYK